MLRLHVDRQIMLPQHRAGIRPDRPNHRRAQSLPHLLGNPGALGQVQHVHQLPAGSKQRRIDAPISNLLQRRRQLRSIFRQLPVIQPQRDDRGAASLQPGQQTGIRLAIFLQPDRVIRKRHMPIDRLQNLPPSMRLRSSVRRLDPQSAQRLSRLRPAHHGHDIADSRAKPLPIDVPLHLLHQPQHPFAGGKDDHIHLAGDHPIGKIHRLGILARRNLAQCRRNRRHAAALADQIGQFRRPAVLKRGDLQAIELGRLLTHAPILSRCCTFRLPLTTSSNSAHKKTLPGTFVPGRVSTSN